MVSVGDSQLFANKLQILDQVADPCPLWMPVNPSSDELGYLDTLKY